MRISLDALIDEPDVIDEADVIFGINPKSKDPVVFFGGELLQETASSRSTCGVLEVETNTESEFQRLAGVVEARKGHHEYHE